MRDTTKRRSRRVRNAGNICKKLDTAPPKARVQDTLRIDRNGTLHVRDLAIPPSEFWSPAFRRYHAKLAAEAKESGESASAISSPPARNASKREWDEFDAWGDERYFAEPLAWVAKHYPVEVIDTRIAGIRVGIISPRGGDSPRNTNRILINLHGGGFVYNRGLMVGQLESIPIAAIGRIKVVTIDYRQAPFHSFPAASQDVEAIYRELLKQYRPASIGVYGGSAGGALAAQAIARFQFIDLTRPGAVGIFGYFPPIAPWPWGPRGDSGIWAQGVTPTAYLSAADQALHEPERWYMEGADVRDPTAYPGSFDQVLEKFPPTLLLAGTREYWLSSAIAAHANLLRLGVDASLYVMEGATHLAHVMAVETPEAYQANSYIAQWFDQRLAR